MVGKKTENKAVGRTKGGLNTKIHAIVDGLGNPVAFLLSAGNDNDSTHAIKLLEKTDIAGSNLLGDKAYGTKDILAYIQEHGATVVIPPKSNTKQPFGQPQDRCLQRRHGISPRAVYPRLRNIQGLPRLCWGSLRFYSMNN